MVKGRTGWKARPTERVLMQIDRLFTCCVLALTATVSAAPIPIAPIQRAEPVSFEKEIFPMLQRSCLACHSASVVWRWLVEEKNGDHAAPVMVTLTTPAFLFLGTSM